MNRYRPLSRLFLLIGLFLGLVAAAPAPEGEPPAEPAPAALYRIYLPLVIRRPSVIHGRVTDGGAAAANVPLSLRFFDGLNWSTRATTTTDAQGHYQFAGQPGLGAGQRYQVTFDNPTANDQRLAWWGTRHLTSYAANTDVHIGNFDLAAVALTEPGHGATLSLPATFRWNRRAASSSDSYALRLYDSSDLNPLYVAPYVGYGGSQTLNSLPDGFALGTSYTWDVIVLAPDGATGVSRAARSVRFTAGIFGRVTQNGAAAGGVPLQLRFFNGTTWSTSATTTTAADGTYAFPSAPTLGAGQKYYVRFENVTQTAGRLFLWSTRSLTTYTAGSALDLGSFDIADVALVSPGGGAAIDPPGYFQWTRRTATPNDQYILEFFDPADYAPRWLSPLLGYAEGYQLNGVPPGFSTYTTYAWEVIVISPDGGSGVSRMARLVSFIRYTFDLRVDSAEWPFDEEPPARPPEQIDGWEALEGAGQP